MRCVECRTGKRLRGFGTAQKKVGAACRRRISRDEIQGYVIVDNHMGYNFEYI